MLLAQELLLIAFDDEKGRDATWTGALDHGLAGALLLDLSLTEAIALDDGRVVVTGDADDPLLRDALAAIRDAGRSRDAKHWVGKLPGALRPLKERVARGLVEQGVLREQRAKVLGLFPRTSFPQVDGTHEAELRARLARVLVDGEPADARTALLVSLLVPLDLVKAVVPRAARKDAGRRAKEVADQGIVGTGLDRVVKELQAAMTAAVIAATASATAASAG